MKVKSRGGGGTRRALLVSRVSRAFTNRHIQFMNYIEILQNVLPRLRRKRAKLWLNGPFHVENKMQESGRREWRHIIQLA